MSDVDPKETDDSKNLNLPQSHELSPDNNSHKDDGDSKFSVDPTPTSAIHNGSGSVSPGSIDTNSNINSQYLNKSFEGVSQSFAGLLTTASMFAGLKKLQEEGSDFEDPDDEDDNENDDALPGHQNVFEGDDCSQDYYSDNNHNINNNTGLLGNLSEELDSDVGSDAYGDIEYEDDDENEICYDENLNEERFQDGVQLIDHMDENHPSSTSLSTVKKPKDASQDDLKNQKQDSYQLHSASKENFISNNIPLPTSRSKESLVSTTDAISRSGTITPKPPALVRRRSSKFELSILNKLNHDNLTRRSSLSSIITTPTDYHDNYNPHSSMVALPPSRQGSIVSSPAKLSTIKKAISLSNKLRKTFNISEDDEFIGDYSCWLMGEVLLQGHLYITKRFILFFAFLPTQKEGVTVKAGTLTTKHFTGDQRKWAVLKDTSLSIYSSSTDLYFPDLVIDLRLALRAEIVYKSNEDKLVFSKPTSIRVVSENSSRSFVADNLEAAKSWVAAIKKQIFAARNSGGQVALKIPLYNIVDLELTSVIGLTKTLRVKVLESEDSYAFDDYFLMFFSKGDEAIHEIKRILKFAGIEVSNGLQNPNSNDSDEHDKNKKDLLITDKLKNSEMFKAKIKALKLHHSIVETNSPLLDPQDVIEDDDVSDTSSDLLANPLEHKISTVLEEDEPSVEKDEKKSSSILPAKKIIHGIYSNPITGYIRRNSLSNPLVRPVILAATSSHSLKNSTTSNTSKSASHSQSQMKGPLLIKNADSKPIDAINEKDGAEIISVHSGQNDINESPNNIQFKSDSSTATLVDTTNSSKPNSVSSNSEKSRINEYYTSLKPISNLHPWRSVSLVKGIYNKTSELTQSLLLSSIPILHYDEKNSLERGSEDEYFVSDVKERKIATDKFRTRFSLSDNDKLISAYPAYLLRSIPIYGKLYLGSSNLCYRSKIPVTHTLMILPYSDIENVYKETGFKFGYYGLVVVIHGHEELFFEFASIEARDDCEYLLLRQLDMFKSHSGDSTQRSSVDSLDDYKLSESFNNIAEAKLKFIESKISDEIGYSVPMIQEENPYISKTSLIDINTSKPANIVLLTIGSRGDVQPYIALGKKLIKEGHNVKIVTHAEFEDWIVSHGISFGLIAGDPSELMSLMVSNPTISYSWIKEAKAKFTSWIDEVLKTSWKACQGADLLIESPSCMSGIHIAEKLQIPYFRAFTMPWTRTRAYPHAFLVPDQKHGGAYNYMTHVAFENGYWKGISSQVNKWRVKDLGLPKTNLRSIEQYNVPFLYNISPAVFPPSVDFPEWVTVTGYWFLDEAKTYEPPKELTEFIANARKDKKKIVYIGFGSIVVDDPKSLTQAIVDAVIDADVRCILNKGWSDRLGKKTGVEIELPKEVYNSGNVPHDWLFTQIDAAVHHGGSGSTGASLRAGLPTVVKPFFGDQKFYGNRVEDLGCGVNLKQLTSRHLSDALKKVTTNKRIIEKAKSIGEQIRSEDGVSKAIATIYAQLDYAKKLSVDKANGKDYNELNVNTDDNKLSSSWLMI